MKTVKTMPPNDREVVKLSKERKTNQTWLKIVQDSGKAFVMWHGLPKGKAL